ncbi:hypothetical protein V8F33_013024 [Rhypophila sp. PSN 637]
MTELIMLEGPTRKRLDGFREDEESEAKQLNALESPGEELIAKANHGLRRERFGRLTSRQLKDIETQTKSRSQPTLASSVQMQWLGCGRSPLSAEVVGGGFLVCGSSSAVQPMTCRPELHGLLIRATSRFQAISAVDDNIERDEDRAATRVDAWVRRKNTIKRRWLSLARAAPSRGTIMIWLGPARDSRTKDWQDWAASVLSRSSCMGSN